MQHAKRSLLIGLGGLTLVAMLTGAFFFYGTTHAAPAVQNLRHLAAAGSATIGTPTSGNNANGGSEISPQQETDQKTVANTPTVPVTAPTTPPNPVGNGVANSNPGASGFNGLDHFDTRTASGGNAFSLEPPDQGLCVGGDFVVESVNDVIAVYRTSDHAMVSGPTALNAFFGLPFAINRTTGARGPFLSDPKCYFDASTNRWFLTILEIDAAPSVRTHTLIAVTQTSNPNGVWSFFSIDATDDGNNGTPSHANCPCLGDQPLIGADKYGFYITTNEFPLFTNGFNGAQVYAISKSQLVAAAEHAGALPSFVQIDASQDLVPFGGLSYSIQPATSPKLGNEPNGGTEYFLSALQFGPAPLDNRIAEWAITNTSSLGSENPNVSLKFTVFESEVYGQPPVATQKASTNLPLANCLNNPSCAATIIGTADPFTEVESTLNSNDDRMNQVVFANGLLWSGLNTVVQTETGPARVGVAYFVVQPGWHNGNLTARMTNQGYVSLANENVLFPSIGVNADGNAVMAFSVSGPDYFPSTGYAIIRAHGEAGKVHIAGLGTAPDDGFTGYQVFGGPPGRWGDYSAAVAGPDCSIWMAAEYIPNAPRTLLANWGTFITNVNPNVGD